MSAKRRVVVTGIGIISPVGNDIPTAWKNVVDGVSAISRRAAAATKVCERQCGGNVSHRW